MLGNRAEDELTAWSVLPRHPAKPGRHLSSVFKLTAIVDLADQFGKYQRSHARDALQGATAWQLLAERPNLRR
jgi:hypothetical protein